MILLPTLYHPPSKIWSEMRKCFGLLRKTVLQSFEILLLSLWLLSSSSYLVLIIIDASFIRETQIRFIKRNIWGFPGGTVVKNPPANAGAQVQALVWEHPTWRGATKPMCHNYCVCTLEPANQNYWAHVSQLLKPARLEPVLRNKSSHRNEKPVHRNEE